MKYGWVTSSSARRDWLFVQFNKDMDDQGRKLYECLNNLGALCQVPPLWGLASDPTAWQIHELETQLREKSETLSERVELWTSLLS